MAEDKPMTHYRKYKTSSDNYRRRYVEANREKINEYNKNLYHSKPEARARKIQKVLDRYYRLKAEKEQKNKPVDEESKLNIRIIFV